MQKLGLARIVFKEYPFIILDEPSSALDAYSEDELIRTFNKTLLDKTVVYISHRLSIAKYADKVIFIDENKISGMDSHKILMETNKEYRNMYETQAKHYIIEVKNG